MEKGKRHVAEGEVRIARQNEIIVRTLGTDELVLIGREGGGKLSLRQSRGEMSCA